MSDEQDNLPPLPPIIDPRDYNLDSAEDRERYMSKLNEGMDVMDVRMQMRMQQAIKERGPRNGWFFKDEGVDEEFELDGLRCWIWHNQELWDELDCLREIAPHLYQEGRSIEAGYCGYACFPVKPVVEPGYRGILTYVPVHGGITYACHDEIGSVYGFDTGHATSCEYPVRDKEWIKNQTLLMILGIKLAAKIEGEYLAADGDNQKRAELVQPLVELGDDLNFGTMVNLLGGEL